MHLFFVPTWFWVLDFFLFLFWLLDLHVRAHGACLGRAPTMSFMIGNTTLSCFSSLQATCLAFSWFCLFLSNILHVFFSFSFKKITLVVFCGDENLQGLVTVPLQSLIYEFIIGSRCTSRNINHLLIFGISKSTF